MAIANKEKIKKVLPHIAFTAFYTAFLIIYLKVEYENNRFIRIADVNSNNLTTVLKVNFISSILILIVILMINRYRKKTISNLGICIKNPLIIAALSAVYIGLFIIKGDFSIVGFYVAFYYLIIIAFSEELIFRGYLFGIINEAFGDVVSVVLSGIIFGAMHTTIPIVVDGMNPLIAVSSQIGGGIIGTALFVFIYKKSGTLLIPILVHAIFNYLRFN